MFYKGFPSVLKNEYDIVLPLIGRKTICDNMQGFSEGYNSENEWYFLADGSAIRFPYRVYYADEDSVYNELSATEKLVYDCIFTRSCDGYIRQKH